MRIKKVLIQNYRSIKYSGEVLLDRKINTLLGRNESGKTNLLKALQAFGRDSVFKRDDLCTYSESTKKLETGSLQAADIPMVTIWFTLEEEDKSKLGEIHDELARLGEIKITKSFDNNYELESDILDLSSMKIVDMRELSNWGGLKSRIESLKAPLNSHAERHLPFDSSKDEAEQHIDAFLERVSSINEINELKGSVAALTDVLKSLPNQDELIQNDIVSAAGEIDSLVQALESEISEAQQKGKITEQMLEAIMPSFVYFTNVDIIEDSVGLSELQSNKENHKTLDNLCVLAGLDVDKLSSADNPYERRSATELASTVITGLVNSFWTQEKVKVSIGIDGDNLIVFVSDDVGAFDSPSRRSQGFQWFLSFYVNFTVGSRRELKDTILLMDDPGVYLHPVGQEDLKKTFEELSESNQIIFATHSPFMVYRENMERIRIVEKKSHGVGTELLEKYWVSDYDALAPLRAALGVKLGDVPFSHMKNLIVEGTQDLVYLEAMVSYFKRGGRKPVIDLSKILVLPSNGANKVPFYANFLMREGRRVAVILDYDTAGRKVHKTLIDNLIVGEEQIITLEQVKVPELEGEDVESEDLFAPEFYKSAVNEVYKSEIAEGKIDLDKLDTSIKKQTKRYKELFKETGMSFSEIAVAQQIRLMVDSKSCNDEDIGQGTIDSFSKLFEGINRRLM